MYLINDVHTKQDRNNKMRIWTSEHTFEHQWDTVVQAVWRKYPNPLNPSVIGIDILDRSVCPQTSVMRTHRLIGCKWGLPGWAESLLGRSKTYASEYSEIDPRAKNFTLRSKNISFCNELSIIEQLTYKPHPSNPNKTLMTQETVVEVHGIPLSSYLEDFVHKDIMRNAAKGRQAMELVIGKINEEVHDLAHKTVKSVDELAGTTKRVLINDDLVNRTQKNSLSS
ncbi:PRELI domain containing slowmo isoform X1 [Dermatophagoides pteronyssinus]|uniref:PRELI domain containing slowmo isoform X1 n=1 Tax=Dermatophagoides pteronyssinus TaxID=6956 RepID=UPI003F67BE39